MYATRAISCAILVLVAGCGKSTPAEGTAPTAADPVAALKAVMTKAQANIEATPATTRAPQPPYFPDWSRFKVGMPAAYELDVQKTQSLVSPFLGKVKFQCTVRSNKASSEADVQSLPLSIEGVNPCELDFAFQDNRWVLKRMTCDPLLAGSPRHEIQSADESAAALCRRAVEAAAPAVLATQ